MQNISMSASNGAFAKGVTCLQGTLTLPVTWFHTLLGIAYALIIETFSQTCHDFL